MAAVHDLSSGSSKILWEIRLMWNGGRKEEIRGFYWSDSVDDVNRIAIGLWDGFGDPEDRDCEDNIDGSCTDPGKPYQGFATLYNGQASCLITVSPVKYSKERCRTQMYGIMNIKKILKSRQISYKAGDKKDALAQQLRDYLSVWIPASTKEEQQEKDEEVKNKEKDEKVTIDEKNEKEKIDENGEKDESNDGAPQDKRLKLKLSAAAE